mmetsp:Transcript_96185/g.298942  ORF Transcript_96185/g.298942 Transcript_96185/m.298942 type:complete len:227 (-) Transcript_96185:8-688(-)
MARWRRRRAALARRSAAAAWGTAVRPCRRRLRRHLQACSLLASLHAHSLGCCHSRRPGLGQHRNGGTQGGCGLWQGQCVNEEAGEHLVTGREDPRVAWSPRQAAPNAVKLCGDVEHVVLRARMAVLLLARQHQAHYGRYSTITEVLLGKVEVRRHVYASSKGGSVLLLDVGAIGHAEVRTSDGLKVLLRSPMKSNPRRGHLSTTLPEHPDMPRHKEQCVVFTDYGA